MLEEMGEDEVQRPTFVVPRRVGEEGVGEAKEARLALLCSVVLEEASQFCARLAAEGIECGAREAAGVEGAVDRTRYADIFVHAEDLEMAREVLSRPAEPEEEGATAGETEAGLVANWICPRCGRRGLDLVPVAGWVKVVWAGLVVTLLAGLLAWLAAGWTGWYAYPGWLEGAWVAAVIWRVWMSIPAERRRRCGGCGWDSGD
jgi:hypothetical protein